MSDYRDKHLTSKALPKHWAKICLLNLIIACTLGLIMRYKIAYPLPFVNQDFMLHAHAHFVFCGWACLTLFSCMVVYMLPDYFNHRPVYKIMFFLLEGSSIGMLISFLSQGFGVISIFFSILFMLVFYGFIVCFWRDHSKCNVPKGIIWFTRMAFVWFVIASFGLYFLSNISINGSNSPIFTRTTLYFYFHFTYNGFFTFAIFGLLLHWLYKIGWYPPKRKMKFFFILMTAGIIPGYFLSIIGFYPYIWIELLSIFAVVVHLLAGFVLFFIIWKNYRHFTDPLHWEAEILWKIAVVAFFLKIIFQGASLIPSLANFAFTCRPLIIGYLHLAFLCFISFFLIGFLLDHHHFHLSTSIFARMGLWLFIIFAILNEVILFGHAFLIYSSIFINYSYISITLLWVTVGIFLGLLFFIVGQIGAERKIAERERRKI